MFAKYRDVERQFETILTPAQLDEARRLDDSPLAPEEWLYYPITSLTDLAPERRAKLETVFRSLQGAIRADAGNMRGRDPGDTPPDGARERRLALFEVADALLTPDQMIAVKQFLPERLRSAALRERVVYRLPTLTLEQEAKARAIFAALEDETSADRARQKAIQNELKGDGGGDRQALRDERRQLEDRITAREATAYDELSKVLTSDQRKALEAGRPGPPQPLVFRPDAIRGLNLTAEQRALLGDAFARFMRGTVDERQDVAELREQIKGNDPQSMEMAGVRDQLRKASVPLEAGRDHLTRLVADTLTGEQLAELVKRASTAKRQSR
jgi:Spy/CpxP family protein refolding chaperone